jgi:hypothetical protein
MALKYPEFEWEQRLDEELVDSNKLGTPDDYDKMEDYLEKKLVHSIEKKETPKNIRF